MVSEKLLQLKNEILKELSGNILPFWMTKASDPKGGFYGQILHDNTIISDAPRGGVLNARILWTFSAAYNQFQHPAYLETANKAFDYINRYFIDPDFGGIYWKIDAQGRPLETKKQIYALAFAVYGLVEYYVASDKDEALMLAMDLYQSIEEHSFDKEKNGYFEAFSREWDQLADLRLSDKDENEAKTMNTHLHILEAYTRLHSIWKDEILGRQLENLVEIHLDKMLNWETGHFRLFFDVDWNSKSLLDSYGHDIEAVWLIYEAALETGNQTLIQKSKKAIELVAETTLKDAIAEDGSIYYEGVPGKVDKDRHWWPQAEAITGFWYAYKTTGDKKYIETIYALWKYIKQHIVAPNGEWYWSTKEDGSLNLQDDKAGFWKCPYHNSRMCMILTKNI
jgi:cellobiose epimerase